VTDELAMPARRIQESAAMACSYGLLATIAFFVLSDNLASAQEPRADVTENEEGIKNSPWQPIFKQMAEDYRIACKEKPERRFELHPQPVFRWSQPVRGGDDGAVFLWLEDGRPAAVGTIFAWPQSDGLRVVQHEFHSFSTGPFDAVWRGGTIWSPARGVETSPMADAPEPAATASQRLRQIKTIAGEFSANSVDRDDGRWELRLLSKPLYRYPSKTTDDVLDGALFTFTQGTDPEVLLLIEARKNEGRYQWQYACGRFSDYRLAVRYRDREVWSVGLGGASTPDEPYTWYVVERREKPTIDAKDEE
jgi:hypothetical protein